MATNLTPQPTSQVHKRDEQQMMLSERGAPTAWDDTTQRETVRLKVGPRAVGAAQNRPRATHAGQGPS